MKTLSWFVILILLAIDHYLTVLRDIHIYLQKQISILRTIKAHNKYWDIILSTQLLNSL